MLNFMVYDIAIIGGGASGMMAAISASQDNDIKIAILEKNDSCGCKLLITGQGRCNITNCTPIKQTLNKYSKIEAKFLKHSFYNLKNEKLLDIFRKKGLEFKEEENHRVFPITDTSQSVLDVLKSYLNKNAIDIKFNFNVIDVELNCNNIFEIKSNDNKQIKAKKLIVSTGGATYPLTGSTGDGCRIAEKFNHHISTLKPGTFPFIIDDNSLISLKGLSFRNIKLSFKNSQNQNIESFGDMLISHNGLTGPAVLNLSNDFIKNQDYDLLEKRRNFKNEDINIDFLPEIPGDIINNEFIADSTSKKELHNYLRKYLPNNFIKYFLDKINIDENITLANLTKKDRNRIVEILKNFRLTVTGIMDKKAFLTVGGVNLNEINSKTMESKIVSGLYFSGETLDVCGPTGGYNLMIAFTTGYLAGQSAAMSLK
nr:NAD(P)/FAD-dependent oxidoreductase [uncultured Methanobrevibacter sp.]